MATVTQQLDAIAKIIQRADAHGYPCSEDAARLIKTDIATELYDMLHPNGGAVPFNLFMRSCGLTARDGFTL